MSQPTLPSTSIDLPIFQSMPGNSIVLLPDAPVFTIIAATDEYCTTSERTREDLVNKGIFEAFPAPPGDPDHKGVTELRASLEKAVEQKTSDRMPLVRYDIANADGSFGERYWSSVNKPVLDQNGAVQYIIHTAEEMTLQVKSEQSATRIKNLEKSYDLFMQAPVIIGVVKGSRYIIELANDNLLEVWGRTTDVIGQSLFEAIPELEAQGFKALLDQVVASGEPFNAYERPIRLNRGGKEEVIYFDFVYKPYYEDGQEKPVGILAVGHDVTKQVESRQKFKSVIEEAKNPILILMGEDLVLDTANQALFDLWQVGPEAMGKPLLEILPEMQEQGIIDLLNGVLHTGVPFYGKEIPIFFNRKNGVAETVFFDFSYQPYRDADGNIAGVLVMATDISGQVQTRKNLEESESRFRFMSDTVPAIIWVTEKDASCSYLNKRWYDSTGQTEEEALGFGWLTAVHPDDSERSGKIFIDANEKSEPFNLLYRLRQKDGTYRWAIDRGEPRFAADGTFAGYIGSVVDVHEQMMLEEKMRLSEERYRHLFQNSPVAKWDEDFTAVRNSVNELVKKGITDFQSYFAQRPDELVAIIDSIVINDVNEAALRMWGGGKEELLTGLHQFFAEDTMQAFIEEITIIAAGGGRFETETTVKSKQGEKINVLVRIDFPRGYDYSNVPVILVNITERKKAEEALRESENRFRTLAEALPQMVWMRSSEGAIEYGSKHWEEYSGIRGITEAWKAMVHPDDWKPVMDSWERDAQAGNSYRYEVRLKNKEGEYRWHYASGDPIRDDDGNVVKWIGAVTDIHAQKTFAENLEKEVAERTRELQNSERKLEQAVKDLERSNEDLQQFAHVASHDLKEPVRKVLTFSSLLEEELGKDISNKATNYLSKIQSASNRMYAMIDGVLLYSSMNALEQTTEVVHLNEVIKSIEADLEILIQQKGAVLRYDALPHIEGSPILLYQLFYNLINNSLKFAKPDQQPQVELTAQEVPADEVSRLGLDKKREYVKVLLTDNGIGFDQGNAEKIFQTFTRLNAKDKYEGTGLGLSLCRKIVERHGGIIYAESSEGNGARFTILLPGKQHSSSHTSL